MKSTNSSSRITSGIDDLRDYWTCCQKKAGRKSKQKQLLRVSCYELIEASLPVFVGAGIAGAARVIIISISEDDISTEAGLSLIHSLLWYFIGKWAVLTLFRFDQQSEEQQKNGSWILRQMRQQHLSHLLRHAITETAGFAWREFFIIFAFKYLLEEVGEEEKENKSLGVGLAIIAFFMLIIIAAIAVIVGYLAHKYNHVTADENKVLISFDSIAFGFPLAYVLTVDLSLIAMIGGFPYVHHDSYLYSWEESFGFRAKTNAQSAEYLLYAILVTIIASAKKYTEFEQVRSQRNADGKRFSARRLNAALADLATQAHEPQQQQQAQGHALVARRPLQRAFYELRDTSLGYFVGIAWFVFIIDNIQLPTIRDDAAFVQSYVTTLFVTALVSITGPLLLMYFKYWQQRDARRIARNQLHRQKTALPGEILRSPTVSGRTSTFTRWISSRSMGATALNTTEDVKTDEAVATQGCCGNRWQQLLLYSQRARLNRKGLMMIALRLVVGLTWELLVAETFDIIRSDASSSSLAAGVASITASFIVTAALCVHLLIVRLKHRDIDATHSASAANDLDRRSDGDSNGSEDGNDGLHNFYEIYGGPDADSSSEDEGDSKILVNDGKTARNEPGEQEWFDMQEVQESNSRRSAKRSTDNKEHEIELNRLQHSIGNSRSAKTILSNKSINNADYDETKGRGRNLSKEVPRSISYRSASPPPPVRKSRVAALSSIDGHGASKKAQNIKPRPLPNYI